jgi:hypothetical protein
VARGAYRLEPLDGGDVATAHEVIEAHGDLDAGLADASIVLLSRRYEKLDMLTPRRTALPHASGSHRPAIPHPPGRRANLSAPAAGGGGIIVRGAARGVGQALEVALRAKILKRMSVEDRRAVPRRSLLRPSRAEDTADAVRPVCYARSFVPDLNPYGPAKRDAERLVKRAWYRAVDFAKTYVTAALLKTLGLGAAALVAAALNFPVFAVAVVAVWFVASSVYMTYATKIFKAQDRETRWAYVAGKRVQQRELEAKIAMDTVTLALMGERHAPGRLRSASPELRSALALHQNRLRLAEERAAAAEAVKEGTATNSQRRALVRFQRQRQPAPPKGPAVEPIKARREALEAERAELDAEIRSLATAENIAKAMEAEEVKGARGTKRERQDAARKADQAARDRARAGKEPTRREPEHVIRVQMSVNGERNAGTGRGQRTPEQIAKGEDAA